MENIPRNVLILGASSDIGASLAERYLALGYTVIGTFRKMGPLERLVGNSNLRLLKCDILDTKSVGTATQEFKELGLPWDIFISAVGVLEPIGRFFDCNFDAWEKSITANSLAQLRFLHEVHPYRRPANLAHIAFFAGGGTNNPFPNFSAYAASKVFLIKMCELLDDENPDLNVFIVGPGWVKTKIHEQVISSGTLAGSSFQQTQEFLDSGIQGTSEDDIFQCIQWCIKQGRCSAGGRNFSVVHDSWRNGGISLSTQLKKDSNKFKLRRFGNQG